MKFMFAALVCAAFLTEPVIAQQIPRAGSQAWGNDGVLYQSNGRQWLATQWVRRFPNRANPNVFDVYQNGQLLKKIDTSRPGHITEYQYAGKIWVKYPIQGQNEYNTFSTYQGKWISTAQIRAAIAATQKIIAQQQAQALQRDKETFVLGGQTMPPTSNGGRSSTFTLGGQTSDTTGGYNMNPGMAQFQAGIQAQQAAMARTWVAPACNSRYNECR